MDGLICLMLNMAHVGVQFPKVCKVVPRVQLSYFIIKLTRRCSDSKPGYVDMSLNTQSDMAMGQTSRTLMSWKLGIFFHTHMYIDIYIYIHTKRVQ